ncbi:hypothetical protein Ahia01_000345500 [Argonauta hians]
MSRNNLDMILNTFQNVNKKKCRDYSRHMREFTIEKSSLVHKPWASSKIVDANLTTEKKNSKFQSKQLDTVPSINNIRHQDDRHQDDTEQVRIVLPQRLRTEKSEIGVNKFRERLLSAKSSTSGTPSPIKPLTHIYAPARLSKSTLGVTKKDKKSAFKYSLTPCESDDKLSAYSFERVAKILMKKLKQGLKNLPEITSLTNIEQKIHCLKSILNELIIISPVFGYILQILKKEYELYISYLLNFYVNETLSVQCELENLFERHVDQFEKLQTAEIKVEKLECEMINLLCESKRIRKLIREEENKMIANNSIETQLFEENLEETTDIKQKFELYDGTESIRLAILEKQDEINRLTDEITTSFVPISVYLNLEQSLRDTELEIQKLKKQNEYYQSSIVEMGRYLQQAIVAADTSQSDVRRIWKRIHVKQIITGNEFHGTISELDDEECEKWNWYIS